MRWTKEKLSFLFVAVWFAALLLVTGTSASADASQYEGRYQITSLCDVNCTFFGSEPYDNLMTIDENGDVIAPYSGSVAEDGTYSGSYNAVIANINYTGTIAADGTIEGVWASDVGGAIGTFSGARVSEEPPVLSEFTGSYQMTSLCDANCTFFGTEPHENVMWIDENGNLIAPYSGSVAEDGTYSGSYNAVIAIINYTGTIAADGTIEGVWASDVGGAIGTFSGARVSEEPPSEEPPGDLAQYAGSYQMLNLCLTNCGLAGLDSYETIIVVDTAGIISAPFPGTVSADGSYAGGEVFEYAGHTINFVFSGQIFEDGSAEGVWSVGFGVGGTATGMLIAGTEPPPPAGPSEFVGDYQITSTCDTNCGIFGTEPYVNVMTVGEMGDIALPYSGSVSADGTYEGSYSVMGITINYTGTIAADGTLEGTWASANGVTTGSFAGNLFVPEPPAPVDPRVARHAGDYLMTSICKRACDLPGTQPIERQMLVDEYGNISSPFQGTVSANGRYEGSTTFAGMVIEYRGKIRRNGKVRGRWRINGSRTRGKFTGVRID